MAFAALFQPQSARVRAPGRDDGWWNPWEMTQKSMVRCQISAKLPEFPQTFKWAIHLKSRVNGGILKTVATYDYWCVNNFTNSAEYLAPRTLARAPWRWSLRLWTFEAGVFDMMILSKTRRLIQHERCPSQSGCIILYLYLTYLQCHWMKWLGRTNQRPYFVHDAV